MDILMDIIVGSNPSLPVIIGIVIVMAIIVFILIHFGSQSTSSSTENYHPDVERDHPSLPISSGFMRNRVG